MSKINFVHTSDWHLGFYQYNKHERFDDFRSAVEKTISKIIEIDPMFVLHTGDIFHHARPSPATIRQAVRQLQRLREHDIPIYIIRGNHDGKDSIYLKRGGGIIALLEDFELVHYVKDTIVSLPNTNSNILGVGYYPGKQAVSYIDEILEEDAGFLSKDTFSIVAIHAFVEGQLEETSQISLKKIKELGVNYLGAGHYHIPWKDEMNNVYAPGSPETTAITDANRDDMVDGVSAFSSFYEVESQFENGVWSQPKIITHQIEIRPKFMIYHNTKARSIEIIKEELRDLIEQKKEIILEIAPSSFHLRPILSLDLQTQLSFEDNSQLYIEEWFEEDFLHIITDIDGKSSSIEMTTDLGTSLHREDVIMDLVRAHDLDEEIHTQIILDLLDEFKDYPLTKELADDEFHHIGQLLLQEEPEPVKQEDQPIGLDALEELIE